jgi:hypothetical protein
MRFPLIAAAFDRVGRIKPPQAADPAIGSGEPAMRQQLRSSNAGSGLRP